MKKIFLGLVLFFICSQAAAQKDSVFYSKFTTAQNRALFYKNLLSNSITRNLSFPLTAYTEEKWESAFSAIELINFQQEWIQVKIKKAFDSIQNRSTDFQESLLEMLYAGGHTAYTNNVTSLLNNTTAVKVFAMSAEYLVLCDTSKKNVSFILKATQKKSSQFTAVTELAVMNQLNEHLQQLLKKTKPMGKLMLQPLFAKDYLKGNVVVYSIQRKNRNYPGLTIVKDTAGNFIRDDNGELFSVAQLARSLSNMPGYITNGNTPQGVFRLRGFDKSRSLFIGPTTNLQLTMPGETSPQHFLKDSSITDTAWKAQWYKRLLPEPLKNYLPLYQAYYAGVAGRTEIIAHGTTVDPAYYAGQPFENFTPTAGCLCTKEIWDANGKRIFSDQQKLADAVKQAGGADGYLIVIEINDIEKKVSPEDILPYLPVLAN